MSTAVDAAIEEIADAVRVSEELLEGARHFAEMADLQPETREVVNLAVIDYDRRTNKLHAVRDSLAALVLDGYPELPQREVETVVLEDLRQDADAVNATLAKFTARMAKDLGLSGSPPVPKDT